MSFLKAFRDYDSSPGVKAHRGYGMSLLLASLLSMTVLLCWGGAAVLSVKAVLAQVLISTSWQRSLGSGETRAPWPWADTHPVARLLSPKGELYVLAGVDGSTLAFGPGWFPESFHPARGTVAIAAHRDTHFKGLGKLRRGERLTLELMDGSRFYYEVAYTRIVDSMQEELLLDPDVPELKLVTCYPFDALLPGGTLRYVVTAIAVTGTWNSP